MPVLKVEKALQNFLHSKKGRRKVAEVLISHGLLQNPMSLKEALEHIGETSKNQEKQNKHNSNLEMNENLKNMNEGAQQDQQCVDSLKLGLVQASQVPSLDQVEALQEESEKPNESSKEENIDVESYSEGEISEDEQVQMKRDEAEMENNDMNAKILAEQHREPQVETHPRPTSPASSTVSTSIITIGSEDLIDTLSKIIKNTVQEAVEPLRKDIRSLNTKMDNMEKRMDSIEKRMDSIEKRMNSIEERMDAQQKQIAVIQEMSIATLLSQSFPPAEHNVRTPPSMYPRNNRILTEYTYSLNR